MEQSIKSEHYLDSDKNRGGGCTYGVGFTISWQRGGLGCGKDRKEPNGAFVEGIIQAAVDRLEYYQSTKFKCVDNENAITHLQTALVFLNTRTKDREKRGVEGTHEA